MNLFSKTGMVVHFCNFSTQHAGGQTKDKTGKSWLTQIWRDVQHYYSVSDENQNHSEAPPCSYCTLSCNVLVGLGEGIAKLAVVVHTFSPGTGEVEEGGR